MSRSLLQFFAYEHLQSEKMREVSKKFHDLAHELLETLPNNPAVTIMLGELIEAKDWAVRSLIYKEQNHG